MFCARFLSKLKEFSFFLQAEDGIRDWSVTGVQTCALLFSSRRRHTRLVSDWSSDVCSSDLNGKGGDILHKGDFMGQCQYAYDKIKRLLEKQGATLGDVAKMVTYITDARYQPDYGKCRVEAFGANPLPAHTLLNISQLAWPGMMVEIDVTAVVAAE